MKNTSRTTLAAIGVLAALLAGTACEVEEEPKTQSTVVDESVNESSSDGEEKKPARPAFTAEQENAIEAAQNYLEFSAFSRKGLIEQLSSSAGDGYPRKVAEFAVNQLKVDYRQQAVRAAKNYLDFSSFSRQGLIEQLSSSAGDGYTRQQAEFAVNQVMK